MKRLIASLLVTMLLISFGLSALADSVAMDGPDKVATGSTKTKANSRSNAASVPVSSITYASYVWFWVNRAGTSTAVSWSYKFTQKTNRALYKTSEDIPNPINAGENVTARFRSPADVGTAATVVVQYTWTP